MDSHEESIEWNGTNWSIKVLKNGKPLYNLQQVCDMLGCSPRLAIYSLIDEDIIGSSIDWIGMQYVPIFIVKELVKLNPQEHLHSEFIMRLNHLDNQLSS